MSSRSVDLLASEKLGRAHSWGTDGSFWRASYGWLNDHSRKSRHNRFRIYRRLFAKESVLDKLKAISSAIRALLWWSSRTALAAATNWASSRFSGDGRSSSAFSEWWFETRR
jgi:hypothetical protein